MRSIEEKYLISTTKQIIANIGCDNGIVAQRLVYEKNEESTFLHEFLDLESYDLGRSYSLGGSAVGEAVVCCNS